MLTVELCLPGYNMKRVVTNLKLGRGIGYASTFKCINYYIDVNNGSESGTYFFCRE